jgi:HK97 family phage major capsid protein
MRIDEIQERLKAIEAEIDAAEGDALTALENEVETLTNERTQILADIETRKQMRTNIAEGLVHGTIIEEEKENEKMNERTYTPDSVEYREAYLMKLQGRALNDEQRAAVAASAAIPTQTMNKVVGYLEGSPLLSRVDLTYIPSNVSYPVESANNDAAWVAMGNAATDAADALTTITLGAYKLIKTVEITADVEAMSIDAFEAWLASALGAKISKALDAAIINGTGTNQATGICTTVSATGTFAKAKATYADLINIVGSLKTEAARNAAFILPRKLFFTDVIGIEDSSKRPICHVDVESPAKYNVLGYPVVIDDNVPADNILFGDLKAYKMNIAKAPAVESDDSVAFRTGSRVYRAMALADGKLAVANAFVRFNRGA